MILFGQTGGMDFDEETAYRYVYTVAIATLWGVCYTSNVCVHEPFYRDVFHQSTCDDGCLELARLLGLGVSIH